MLSLLAASYGTISDIEIIFLLISLGGFIFSCYNIREASRDVYYLKERMIGNGRMKIAKMSFKTEFVRAIIQSIYIALAIIAMTQPDVPIPHETYWMMIERFIFTWGFITATALLTLKSYWNWSLRRDLLSEGARENDPTPEETKAKVADQ